jgi:hypothetical protein
LLGLSFRILKVKKAVSGELSAVSQAVIADVWLKADG